MSKSQKKSFINPITRKRHIKWEAMHRAIHRAIDDYRPRRGKYDEIVILGYHRDERGHDDVVAAGTIISVFRPALHDEYCEFDRKGRGLALNHDLYGYDPSQGVAVIQARQAIGSKYGMSTRKTYFLVGRNEITGEYFRHPVGSHAVRAAIKSNPDPALVVAAVQRWMWEVTDKQLTASIRQGDILLVPERSVPNITSRGTSLTVAESHHITADEILLNGRCYALNPTITHTKGQHAPVAVDGWCSIRVARESSAWDFAQRIGD